MMIIIAVILVLILFAINPILGVVGGAVLIVGVLIKGLSNFAGNASDKISEAMKDEDQH